MPLEIKPIEVEEIKPRGKFRRDVVQCVKNFLKLIQEKGIRAVETENIPIDKAHSYYDSFRDYVRGKNLDIDVKIRKMNEEESKIILVAKSMNPYKRLPDEESS